MFNDKNGNEIKIGDYIMPDDGIELLITEEKYMEMVGCECLIGTQVPNPEFFSILTQENLSKQWTKSENIGEYQTEDIDSKIQPLSIQTDSINKPKEDESNQGIYEPEPDRDKDWKEREKISAK